MQLGDGCDDAGGGEFQYLSVVDALVDLPDEAEHEQLPVLPRHVRKVFPQRVLPTIGPS